MRIDGHTRLLGLLGDPVQHTMSPVIHNTLSDILDINDVYVPMHTRDTGLCAAVKGAYELNILGLNVTVPHKGAVMGCLADVDEAAQAIGAVNTLVRTDGGYKGYNTDMMGLTRELDVYGVELAGRNVIILGAGGAARAVAYMCMERQAAHIYILNRTVSKAQAIADDMNCYFGRKTMTAMELSEFKSLPGYDNPDICECGSQDGDSVLGVVGESGDYIVFQSTSIGLAPNIDDVVIGDADFYRMVDVGIDLIYNPFETRFMRLCREAGARAENGLRMLLYQGIIAYELWNDIRVSEKTADIVYGRLIAAVRRNIILIGFMGCGKTTVGAALSEHRGLELLDTDEYIEREQGCSVRDIFATVGEEQFRRLETETLEKLNRSLTGTVVSTGGGVPMRPENVALLRQMGTVVYLRVSPEEVIARLAGDTARPLLSGDDAESKVRTLMGQRAPIYEAAADYVVDVDGRSVEEIAADIIADVSC